MNTSSTTLLQTIEWSKRLNFRRPVALGNFLEPAITNANIVLQTILGAPFCWRWNRVVTGFITTPGQQDYFIFNWTAGFPISLGSVTVDNFGNCQSCTTQGTTGVTQPTWNSAVGGTTIDGSVIWTNLGSIDTPVSQIYNFGFIEFASALSITSPSPLVGKWYEIESKTGLALDQQSLSRPRFISPQADDGNNNITFRLMPVPDVAYPISITIQQKPPVLTSLNQTWSPVPDQYSRLYSWGFLALFYLFSDDPRFNAANQKFVSQLLSVNEGITEAQRNIFLANWQYITGVPIENSNRTQQGDQMRGV